MKYNYINNLRLIVVSVLFMLSGCVKEVIPSTGERVPLTEFELEFQAEGSQIITRLGQEINVENAVTNLYVLLFNKDGVQVHSKRYSVSNTTTVPDGYEDVINSYSIKQNESDGLSKGVIPRFFDNFDNTDALGAGMTFYAIANYSNRLANKINERTTASELESLTYNFTMDGNVDRSSFLMVAKYTNASLTVDENNNIGRIGVNLHLRRVDAKITFNVSVDIPEADPGSISFTNMTYRVHNVPNTTYLFEKEKESSSTTNNWDAAAQSSDGYSCMLDDNYQTFDDEYSDGTIGGFFSFYLRENRPVVTNPITDENKGDFSTLYAMREAWDGTKNGPVHGRNFKYAPKNATFVEINGVLSYTRTSGGGTDRVYGRVTYIVHLGETGNDPNNEIFVNNYDVRRNVRYIYNMKITGINSFVVEVGQEGKEVRPGAEGNIVITDDKLITLDAHYGRFLLILNRQTLTDDASWNTFSPLNSTINDGRTAYNPDSGLIDAPFDYKWVLFAVNKDFRQDDDMTKMVKYPGVQAYDGGVSFFDESGNVLPPEILEERIASDYGNNFDNGLTFKEQLLAGYYPDNYYADKTAQLSDHACLMDVNQLVKYLVKEAKNPNSSIFVNNEVAITGFCDEYTYIYNPAEENYIHPGFSIREEFPNNSSEQKRRLALWKTYVDTDDRVMSITPVATTSYSQDGNTSLTNSFITISQNSIKTIYNPEKVETAWGLEVKNETGKLTWEVNRASERLQTGSRDNTLADGRTNFLNFLVQNNGEGQYRWTDAMTTDVEIESAEGLNDDYRNAFYACLTRNRDLNGNNFIDADEIFWYLAARDQLTGLWIGQYALEDNAWLYTDDMYSDTEVSRNHFISSSYSGTGDDYNKRFWILWAEEGSSFGHLRQSGDDKTNPPTYDYRCVRNLGIDIADQAAPTHFATITSLNNNDGSYPYYTINVDAINSRSLRSSPDEVSLPYDNERSPNNRPYLSGFDVMQSNYGNQTYLYDIRNSIQNNLDPCPQGWRVPTQREFTIMTSFVNNNTVGFSLYFPTTSGGIAIATSFSFAGKGEFDSSRDMFYYDRNLRLKAENENPMVSIRCVRDHTGN